MHDTTAHADVLRALQTVDDLLPFDTFVAGNGAENRIERAYSQCTMRRHRDPMG